MCNAFKTDEQVYLYCHIIEKERSKIVLYKSMDGVDWERVGVVYETDRIVAGVNHNSLGSTF